MRAGNDLDQGGFARPVFSEQCVHLAGPEIKGDSPERPNRPNRFGHRRKLQQWGIGRAHFSGLLKNVKAGASARHRSAFRHSAGLSFKPKTQGKTASFQSDGPLIILIA
jgi:hypothetical protein